MRLNDFDFELPKTAIALRPAVPRDSAKLLVVDPGAAVPYADRLVKDLPGILRAGDVLVFNDTKVLLAEFRGHRPPREHGAPAVEVSLTLLEPLPDGSWRAFARPAKRLRAGDSVLLGSGDRAALHVHGKSESGELTVSASRGESIPALMDEYGAMPLPPYIAKARDADARDFIDYQTVYASEAGAVAAPTAGLHFTRELLDRIESAGARIAYLTLHVGAGTFLPVKAEKADDHEIHAERCTIYAGAAQIINKCRQEGGRIIAVGTTSLRLLETAAQPDGTIAPYSGTTRLFIKPGHSFRSADILITNFHLPRSTLFMLVCAFSGIERMKKAYAHAVASGYRFYSYGDACLLYRTGK